MATAFLPIRDSILLRGGWIEWQSLQFFPSFFSTEKLFVGIHFEMLTTNTEVFSEFLLRCSLHIYDSLQPLATAYNACRNITQSVNWTLSHARDGTPKTNAKRKTQQRKCSTRHNKLIVCDAWNIRRIGGVVYMNVSLKATDCLQKSFDCNLFSSYICIN